MRDAAINTMKLTAVKVMNETPYLISDASLRRAGRRASSLVMRSIIEMFQRIAGAFNNPEFGTTANRPIAVPGFPLVTGQAFFDTTLGKPIWYKASTAQWVDATGTPV
jgi:hypothetical protein